MRKIHSAPGHSPPVLLGDRDVFTRCRCDLRMRAQPHYPLRCQAFQVRVMVTAPPEPLVTASVQAGSASCGCTANNATVTVANRRTRGNCFLGTYNLTTDAGTPRTYEECDK